jgi:hypothetical protein
MNVWGLTKKIMGMGLVCLPLTMSTTLTGCLTDDDPEPTPNTGDSLKSTTVKLGFQGNATYGSFIDADQGFKVLKVADAKAAAADIDLIFAYSGTAKAAAAYSPKTARDGVGGAPGFDFVKTGFDALVATEVKTVDAAKLAAVKTQAGLDSLHAAGVAAPDGRMTLSNGVAGTVKSTKGKVFGFTISDLTVVSGSETEGTVDVKGSGLW